MRASGGNAGGSDACHHRDCSRKRKTKYIVISIMPQKHLGICNFLKVPISSYLTEEAWRSEEWIQFCHAPIKSCWSLKYWNISLQIATALRGSSSLPWNDPQPPKCSVQSCLTQQRALDPDPGHSSSLGHWGIHVTHWLLSILSINPTWEARPERNFKSAVLNL